MEEWYGKQGIDTPYEREKIDYHPQLHYPIQRTVHQIPLPKLIKMERAKDFTISSVLSQYDQLVEKIQGLLERIALRNPSSDFHQFRYSLENHQLQEVIQWEDQFCGYEGSMDAEIYTMLYRMKASIQSRRSHIDRHFRIQLTDDRSLEGLTQKEQESLELWKKDEYRLLDLEDERREWSLEDYNDDGEKSLDIQANLVRLEQEIESLLQSNQNQEVFYTSLADVSYIHRNRAQMFEQIVEEMTLLLENSKTLLRGGVRSFVMRAMSIPDVGAVLSHLVLSFQKIKEEHNALKGQQLFIDDHKEEVIGQQTWFYQQVKVKANQGLTSWLYEQDENSEETFHLFAGIVANSIEDSQLKYEESLVDSMKFYQNEALYYDKQFAFVKKKEEIRLFYRILDDLRGNHANSEEWALEYLKVNGYES